MERVYKIHTSDGELFHVPEQLTRLFPAIVAMITKQDENEEQVLKLEKVNCNVFQKVFQWAHYCHVYSIRIADGSVQDFEAWENNFLVGQDLGELMELIAAAHYLGSDALCNLALKKFAETINGNITAQSNPLDGPRYEL